MKVVVALIVAAATVAISLVSADTGFLDRATQFNGETYRYQVYVPLEWTKAQKWPVVLYLHGNGNQGDDGSLQLETTGISVAIRQQRKRFPMIVVFPQARQGTRWSTPRMQDMALALLDAAVLEFNGDSDRLYLTGFSMGGGGALRVASKWGGKFAAMVETAGGITPPPGAQPGRLLDEDIAAHPFLTAPDPFRVLAASLGDLPIRIHQGAGDETVPVEQSRNLVAALKALNANVTYIEYPRTKHVESADKTWADPETAAWLLARRRSDRSR